MPWNVKNLDQPCKPDKGHKGGSCNRQGCQDPGANWYNHSTRAYYCGPCAQWLNTDTFNRADAQRIWGHDLCTIDSSVVARKRRNWRK